MLILLCLVPLLQGCASFVREATDAYIQVKSAISNSEIKITLNNYFIRSYKNRVTIDTLFTIDRADRRPKPAFLDGDFHFSGRAPEIGLPVVAEIKNSASEKDAIAIIHGFEGIGQPARVSGAWRIWPEHVGTAEEVQGEELSGFDITNPDHVFEIHPVTYVNDKSLLDSFRPVEGYIPGKADTVIKSYATARCRIIPEDKATSIITRKGAFNDVEFIMEIDKDGQHIVEDGRFVNAAILDLKGQLLAKRVRMVFVKDTAPEKIVKNLRPGDRLHVFGLPRIDLSVVAWRAENFSDNPDNLDLNLPYEIIIVGVYK